MNEFTFTISELVVSYNMHYNFQGVWGSMYLIVFNTVLSSLILLIFIDRLLINDFDMSYIYETVAMLSRLLNSVFIF